MSLKPLLLAFLVIYNCFIYESAAKTKVKYPPYPDVWGYDVLDDADTASRLSFDIVALKDGDYALEYYSSSKEVAKTVLHIFSGTKNRFTTFKEKIQYYQDDNLYVPTHSFISLSEGKVINTSFKRLGGSIHCLYVQRRTRDFEEKNNEYELSPIGIATYCDKVKGCVNEAYFLARCLLKLKDDTFFAFDPDYYLFIRFDRDFKTKFKPQHTVKLDGNRELKSNFYVLPYSKIEHFFEHVATGYTGEYTDDINRQFLDYLYEEEQAQLKL